MKHRRLLFVLGPVAALLMFAGTVKMVSVVVSREYRAPYRAPSATVDLTPRAEGLAAERVEAERQARARPYEEAEYRTFPVVGSRVAIWAVAQLHLLFAAFVLAVPLFAFFIEAFFLYAYYYGWGKFHPLVHLGLGLGLNVVGTAIMFIANAWLTFMMSPRGISTQGAVLSVWDAVYNFTWMPINVHRVIANVAFGGSIAAAYGA